MKSWSINAHNHYPDALGPVVAGAVDAPAAPCPDADDAAAESMMCVCACMMSLTSLRRDEKLSN